MWMWVGNTAEQRDEREERGSVCVGCEGFNRLYRPHYYCAGCAPDATRHVVLTAREAIMHNAARLKLKDEGT